MNIELDEQEEYDDVLDRRYTSSERKKRSRLIRSKSPENVPSYKVRLSKPEHILYSENEAGSFGTESRIDEDESE